MKKLKKIIGIVGLLLIFALIATPFPNVDVRSFDDFISLYWICLSLVTGAAGFGFLISILIDWVTGE